MKQSTVERSDADTAFRKMSKRSGWSWVQCEDGCAVFSDEDNPRAVVWHQRVEMEPNQHPHVTLPLESCLRLNHWAFHLLVVPRYAVTCGDGSVWSARVNLVSTYKPDVGMHGPIVRIRWDDFKRVKEIK